jgi:hypothetical protein
LEVRTGGEERRRDERKVGEVTVTEREAVNVDGC